MKMDKFGRFRKTSTAFPSPKRMRDKNIRIQRLIYLIELVVFNIKRG